MKKFLLISVLLITVHLVNAQQPITFADDTQTFGTLEFPGIWVDIPEASAKTILENWAITIQKGTKSKPVISGQDVSLFGALIKDIFEGPVNIESRIKAQDSMVRLFAGVELRRGEFAVSGSPEYQKLKDFLKKFAKDEYIEVAEKQLSAEEARLKDLEKNLSGLRKDRERFDKEIQSSNADIAKENDNILAYRKQLEVTDQSIGSLTTDISLASDPETKKQKESELKSAQKKKKDLLKDISNSENRISKANHNIEDAKNNILLNTKSQEEAGVKINTQKITVGEFVQKLKKIKLY